MSKVMDRLAKLTEFIATNEALKDRANKLKYDSETAETNFKTWMVDEYGLTGGNMQFHLAEILLKTMEASIEPTKRD